MLVFLLVSRDTLFCIGKEMERSTVTLRGTARGRSRGCEPNMCVRGEWVLLERLFHVAGMVSPKTSLVGREVGFLGLFWVILVGQGLE